MATGSADTLTARQREIYEFLRDKIINRGYGPTVREIGAHFSIRSPNGVMCHLKALERKGMIRRESNMSRAIQLAEHPARTRSLRLAGQIVAGLPVLAAEGEEIDFSDIFASKDHVCLQVTDNSLIDERIVSGDHLILREQPNYQEGDIVLALVDQQKTTLGRYVPEPNGVRLEPTSTGGQAVFSASVQVLGVVVAVIRRH